MGGTPTAHEVPPGQPRCICNNVVARSPTTLLAEAHCVDVPPPAPRPSPPEIGTQRSITGDWLRGRLQHNAIRSLGASITTPLMSIEYDGIGRWVGAGGLYAHGPAPPQILR